VIKEQFHRGRHSGIRVGRDLRESLNLSIKKAGWRLWLNIATIVLIVLVIFFARHQLVEAWHLLTRVNIWILLLLIPVQFFSYYANSEIFLVYLRERGRLKQTSRLEAASMSLELNFVNHVFPSGGISGMAYMVWRLGKQGVPAGQATLSELLRYVMQTLTFVLLLVVALIFATVDNKTSSWIVVVVAIVLTALAFLAIFGGYLIGSETRMRGFARWLGGAVNHVVARLTFGHKPHILNQNKLRNLEQFFLDFHKDFLVIKSQKSLLLKPLLWSLAFNLIDVSLFLVTFWALGTPVNPAVMLIAYGGAAVAGTVMFTPGGAGAYEVIMITVLSASGMSIGAATAGVVLTRAILILGTLLSGFVFYQRALHKYGRPELEKPDLTPDEEIQIAMDSLKQQHQTTHNDKNTSTHLSESEKTHHEK
jgi:uncharacterized protein (TIRG00374 family)